MTRTSRWAACARCWAPRTAELERLTRLVYTRGRDVALKQGIIIADTKFEFGRAVSSTGGSARSC